MMQDHEDRDQIDWQSVTMLVIVSFVVSAAIVGLSHCSGGLA